MNAENLIVLIAAPEVLAIPVKENHEELIDIKDSTDILIGPSPEIPNNTDYTKMRREVYQRLLIAQSLLPQGLRFCLYEGYRSLSLQKTLFEARYKKLAKQYANWSHQALFNETIKLVSPVINLDGSRNIPPHATGAAIDVYLVDEQGEAIDMGIHPKDWADDTEALYSATICPLISKNAQANRDLMSHVLKKAGFINYPTEYWHWSYGDRYWAYVSKHPYAIYNCV
ncbi:M15 family metallopeptidase [Legionella gresilensis]|uniref:M15 family metallopeptidase n=1 Tax=Legionella gresilensis TaxID=91823 RepID=UPI001041B249|nr:M15 family metallopeptidase [Legionella gresilensis]